MERAKGRDAEVAAGAVDAPGIVAQDLDEVATAVWAALADVVAYGLFDRTGSLAEAAFVGFVAQPNGCYPNCCQRSGEAVLVQ